jgi:hypothetical protein
MRIERKWAFWVVLFRWVFFKKIKGVNGILFGPYDLMFYLIWPFYSFFIYLVPQLKIMSLIWSLHIYDLLLILDM